MYRIVSFFAGLICVTALQAQDNSLEGMIKDDITSQSLEDASITLYKTKDSSLLTATFTDANGLFKLNKINTGSYYLVVEFIGYQQKVITNIHFVSKQKINLGMLLISPSAELLREISVTGKKAKVYYKMDKQVYKSDQFQAAQGGSAIDVIKNLPSISVNAQGEITMRGSSGFLVLLNGKPVQTDIDVVLNQIPANAIENIELITAPSAKYDPDGKAGIINITTKKGIGDGLFVTANAQGGLPAIHDYSNKNKPVRFGADATANYKKGKWDFSAGGNYLRNDAAGLREGDANTTINNVFTSFPSNGERSFKRYNYSIRASLVYTADKNNSLSIGVYNGVKFQARTADLLYNNSKTDVSNGSIFRRTTYFNDNLQTKNGNFSLGNFDYTHTFTNSSEFTVSLLYEYANLYGTTTNLNQFYPGTNDTIQYTYNTNTNPLHGYRGSINYAVKIGSGKLESGYQFRYDKQNGNFIYKTNIEHTNQYVIDPAFTSGVYTSNQIHSIYSQYGAKVNKLEYTAGLRYEYATRKLSFTGNPKQNKLDLSNLFPSANILYSLDKKWKVKAAYSRRVERTRNFELNPFPEREHSETLEQGDANLLPEFIHLSELGVIKEYKSGSLFLSAYYKQIKNSVQRVNSVYNDTILNRIYTNAGNAKLLGIESGLTVKPVKWWNLFIGANIYRYKINGSLFHNSVSVNNASWNYSINANNSFQLAPSFSFQFGVNYISRRATAQGEESYFLSPNSSLKKTFLNGRLSATIQWQNMDMGLLGSNRQRITTRGNDFYTSTNYIVETDVLLLNISFNLKQFNKKMKLPSSEFGEKEF